MINIVKSSGSSPSQTIGIYDTDEDFFPIMKFNSTVPVLSTIKKASGVYLGHYYWELTIPNSYGSNVSYIWFNGTEWLWSSALGGGELIDSIGAPTSTIYPLGTWDSSSEMSPSSLISPATGLAKSYFNPTCSYTASADSNIVYLKINGDCYDIPLSKLQVSGTNPASLANAISAISTLLTT